MLKIGEFSKLSHITVKALRFYEAEGLLCPARVDPWTGYRLYETEQLIRAGRIVAYRQLGLSLREIRTIFAGSDERQILLEKAAALADQRQSIDVRLSIIHSILEETQMKYQVTEKIIPEAIVYTAETVLPTYGDLLAWVPTVGEECLGLNPGIKCADPPYEFCVYPDGGPSESHIRVRHYEAVTSMGRENEHIRFSVLPSAKVLSIYHKGAYETLPDAYAFLMKYAEQNGYESSGLARECYIDGIWNKESPDEWLTELQLPVK